MAVILIGGGSRSGKTGFALGQAQRHGKRLAYVATAEALDDEMKERVAAHQAERGDRFTTIEEPIGVPVVIEERAGEFDAIIVDCLTVWLANLMLSDEHDAEGEVRRLVESARGCASTIVFVTNEVGTGIVPENDLARRFRDQAGWLNQQIAAASDEVYWMVFGCPLRVK